MNYCSNCGEKYENSTKVCMNCGTDSINLTVNESVKKNKKLLIQIVITLILALLMSFALFHSKFTEITGTWVEGEIPVDVAKVIISRDGNLSVVGKAFENTEILANYELETIEKNIYKTTGMSTMQFSVPEDLELINMESIQEKILDDIFEGTVPERKVKDGLVIYSIKINGDNTNSYIAKLAATEMTIEYLEDDLIDLTTLNSYSTETIQLNRID